MWAVLEQGLDVQAVVNNGSRMGGQEFTWAVGKAVMVLMKIQQDGSGYSGDKLGSCSIIIFPAVESQAKVAQAVLCLP